MNGNIMGHNGKHNDLETEGKQNYDSESQRWGLACFNAAGSHTISCLCDLSATQDL